MARIEQYKIVLGTFPSCCGIFILHNFYKHHDPFTNYEEYYKYCGRDVAAKAWTPEFIAKENLEYLCESSTTYRSRIKSQLKEFINAYKGRKSYFLATLNSSEYENLGDLLLDEGFEILVPWHQNPTGTRIQTYIYYLTEKTTEKKESVFANAPEAAQTQAPTDASLRPAVEDTPRRTLGQQAA